MSNIVFVAKLENLVPAVMVLDISQDKKGILIKQQNLAYSLRKTWYSNY